MFWVIANALCGLIVASILTYKLVFYPRAFTQIERIGMGVLGAGMVLNIAPIMQGAGNPFDCRDVTPYDDWGSTLLRVGCALYFFGRLMRNVRHQRTNDAMKRGFTHRNG